MRTDRNFASARVVVHYERLRKYFLPYAHVECLDHHVKFAGDGEVRRKTQGYLLWVGVRTNLPPLVEWINSHPLDLELRVLTNPEQPNTHLSPADFGFKGNRRIHVQEWSPGAHLKALCGAKGALDIKGSDFRSRHKPPAKAIDFIAAGVPLAMNPDSSPVEYLGRKGFDVCSPLDQDRWFSKDYWDDTRRFGAALRELLSLERLACRLRRLIDDVLAERQSRAEKRAPT